MQFGLPQLAGTQDASGTTLASYIYGVGPLAMIDATGAYRYYTTDQLGSIRADTGPAGGLRDSGGYEPSGEEFTSVLEACVVLHAWLEEYNTRRARRSNMRKTVERAASESDLPHNLWTSRPAG